MWALAATPCDVFKLRQHELNVIGTLSHTYPDLLLPGPLQSPEYVETCTYPRRMVRIPTNHSSLHRKVDRHARADGSSCASALHVRNIITSVERKMV